ncbi:ATP-binding protein [Nonomuraea wenchangensis]
MTSPSTGGYRDNAAHLADELRRLDLLVRRQLAEEAGPARRAGAAQAVYIAREEIDALLADASPTERQTDEEYDRLCAEIDARVEQGLAEGVWLALPMLGRLFGLGPAELLAVVVCLAPELRRSYDRVYAYLQDDITRKRPSVDLVLRLLWRDERRRWTARHLFADTAPLLRSGVLRRIDDPHSPSGSTGLAQFLALDERICRYLLGSEDIDARLLGQVRPYAAEPYDADPALVDGLLRLIEHHWSEPDGTALVFRLHGAAGTAELAGRVCARLGVPLLDLDAAELGPDSDDLVRTALREGVLQRAAVHLSGLEALRPESRRLLRTAVADFGWLVFLGGAPDWAEFPGVRSHALAVPPSSPERRAAVWRDALDGHTDDPHEWAIELAGRFRLPPRRIREAVRLAVDRRLMAAAPGPLTLADITMACRSGADRRIGELAVKVTPRAAWRDLVLPDDRTRLLADLRDQVRHHHRVHTVWGFGAGRGPGLNALFTGPPGTGKTMAAEVLAGDLGLDLFKVDLSGVVSKYIGETEKNLARVFAETESAGAILFFDEADALFGKRTEVSDAHDRYANIETSYLLQKLEEHEGLVILATNLRQNLDEAFTRRIRFVVEFPFPEDEARERIWRSLIPLRTPVAATVDLAALAREYPVSGGNIRNIVLNAAFLAAGDGEVIDQRHLLRATRREYEKIGRLWSEPVGSTPC